MGGLYDLACAFLTLARRQPHHWVERWTVAGRRPIPNDVWRGGGGGRRGGRRANRCCCRERETTKRGRPLTQKFRGILFTDTQVIPPTTAPHLTSAYIISSVTPSVRSSARRSDSRSRGGGIKRRQTASPRSLRQLRSKQPFEAPRQPKPGDRGRDARPRMSGHQTAPADIHLSPAAGFEELMELLSLISACVGGLSSPFGSPLRPSAAQQHPLGGGGVQTCVAGPMLGPFLTPSATKREAFQRGTCKGGRNLNAKIFALVFCMRPCLLFRPCLSERLDQC